MRKVVLLLLLGLVLLVQSLSYAGCDSPRCVEPGGAPAQIIQIIPARTQF